MNFYDAFMSPRDRAAAPGGRGESCPGMPHAAAPVAAKPQPKPEAPACPLAPSLAMVYAPCQKFHRLYAPEAALSRGTLFEELDKPILTAGGKK